MPASSTRTARAALAEGPCFQTERLVVRPGRPGDQRAIVSYYRRNRAFLEPWEPAKPSDFYTEHFWTEQLREFHREAEWGTAQRFFLFPSESPGEVIGYVSYSQITRRAAHYCILGYSLSEKDQGKGLMVEALRATNHWVFDELRLHRIMANYMPHNRRSGAVLRRLGFTVEGYARDYLLIAGRWEDHVLTALLNPSWPSEQAAPE